MIMLTGAGGYIGQHLLRELPENTLPLYRVPNDEGIGLDLTDFGQMQWLEQYAPPIDTVIHLAGRIDIRLYPNPKGSGFPPVAAPMDTEALFRANVLGAINVLDFCLATRVRHLIFASSQTVYGMPDGVLTEQSPCNPLEPYATSKLLAEHAIEVGAKAGLNVTVLRFPGIYGEDKTKGTVYSMCQQALHDGAIRVNAQYPLPIDVLHVDDVTAAFRAAAEHGGNEYLVVNIATGEPCSLNLLADEIAGMVPGCTWLPSEIPQPIVTMDASKAAKLYGWCAAPRKHRLQEMLLCAGWR